MDSRSARAICSWPWPRRRECRSIKSCMSAMIFTPTRSRRRHAEFPYFLPLSLQRDNVMISRLVAARVAVSARRDSALEELSREFRENSFADVATALGGRSYRLSENWHRPFQSGRFLELLFGVTGNEVLTD